MSCYTNATFHCIETLLWTIHALFYHVFSVQHDMSEERKGFKPLQWTNQYSCDYVSFPFFAFSHFKYNHTSLFLILLKTVNRYPFPFHNTCQYHKVVIELKHSQLSVLQDEEAHNGWSFMSDFRFGKLYLVKLVVDIPQHVEQFIVYRCVCLFIICKLCNWMATAILDWIAIRAVCKQIHNFCNNTGVGILVSLTTRIDSGLHKIVEIIHSGLLNEAMNFRASASQLQL